MRSQLLADGATIESVGIGHDPEPSALLEVEGMVTGTLWWYSPQLVDVSLAANVIAYLILVSLLTASRRANILNLPSHFISYREKCLNHSR